MPCKKCQSQSYNPCNCKTTYEPCITAPLVVTCTDPEYCEEVISDRCVAHSGIALPTIGAVSGERLDFILLKIDTLFAQILNVEAD